MYMHSPVRLRDVELNYLSRGATLPFMGVKHDVLLLEKHEIVCEEISKNNIST